MKALVKNIHFDTYSEINEVSYKTGNVFWIHVTHPSKANGTIKAWLKGDVNDSSGLKSSMAKKLIEDNNLKIKSQ